MSNNYVVEIYKNSNSNKPPAIKFPVNLPQKELVNESLITAATSLFTTSGVLTVDNLFSRSLISDLNRSFSQTYASYFDEREYANALEVGNKRRMLTIDIQHPFNNPELYGNLFLMYLMRELLGPDFVLGSFGAVISLPGSTHQHIHRDHPPLFTDEVLSSKIPSFAITVVIPLVDLTPETGSTRVWKGSHKLSRSVDLLPQQSFVPYMPTGSCYLMDYQLLHGGTSNVSKIVRPILYLIYYRSWFQESVNYDKQVRLSITSSGYHDIPDQYKFLFERVRESLILDKNQEIEFDSDGESIEFNTLSSSKQLLILKKVAQKALQSYDIEQPLIELISHRDNTVYSVATPSENLQSQTSAYFSNRYILRIHRSQYLSNHQIESELLWLQALCQSDQLTVPSPLTNHSGHLATPVELPYLDMPRVCSLTQCLKGQFLLEEGSQDRLKLTDIKLVGHMMAELHEFSATWSFPAGFSRPVWNWNGLLGEGAGYSRQGSLIWDLTPKAYRPLFDEISHRVQAVMQELGEDTAQFGLIHADLCPGNILAYDNHVFPIDFADCGFGYWGYDMAMFLSYVPVGDSRKLCLETLLKGYTQVRNFPREQLPFIDLFIAAQHVTLSLWRINRSQDMYYFRSTLMDELNHAAEQIQLYLAEDNI